MCLQPPSSRLEAVNTSETSASFYQTTRPNIASGSHLRTRADENLKSRLQVEEKVAEVLQVQGASLRKINYWKMPAIQRPQRANIHARPWHILV
jgi:hypothetical protein